MKSALLPVNEDERIRKLDELDILDTLEEKNYDDLTLLAAQICDTPIALISLIDRDRQWFKSHHGLDVRETPRELAFCAHAIHGDDLFIVEDSSKDERFHDNPLVNGEPHVKFYAGAPLVMENDIRLGTLCVIGNEPRTLNESQKTALAALARQVVSQLELRLRVKQLESLERAKDEFISMVSHEMRTPLTSINGSLSLLINGITGNLDEQSFTMVDIAHRNASRLLEIVNDILDLAKIKAGKLALDFHAYNIMDLIQQAVTLNQHLVKQHDCKLQFDSTSPETPVMVYCDQFRIIQVMTNFISNAAKYTQNSDTIRISVHTEGKNVRVEVEDHGPGIPKDKQKLLFQRFSQLTTTDNYKYPGTGLGLNISQNLIALHKGTIGFDSIPNQRTIFFFTLPLMNQPAG